MVISAYFRMAATRSLRAQLQGSSNLPLAFLIVSSDNYRLIFSSGHCRGIRQRRSSALRAPYSLNAPRVLPPRCPSSSVLYLPTLCWSVSRRRWLSKHIPRGMQCTCVSVYSQFVTRSSIVVCFQKIHL